jgi:uncharacterized protein
MSETGHYPYQVVIDAYGNGGYRFAGMSHRGSLLCLPTGMHAWPVTRAAEVTLEALSVVLELEGQIDVLLIGLGDDIIAIDPAIRQAFRELGITVEATATAPAVSNYNVMMAEKRAVAGAFIAVERGRR